MSYIKGQNLRVMVGSKCVAAATSASVHVAQELQDSSTKDSTGDWTEQEVTGLSWDASCDALFVIDSSDTTGEQIVDLLDTLIAKTEVTLSFKQTGLAKNRTATTNGLVWTGKALVSDISINADNKQNATYTVKFTGNGALTCSGEIQ